jgi:hypothetical protein
MFLGLIIKNFAVKTYGKWKCWFIILYVGAKRMWVVRYTFWSLYRQSKSHRYPLYSRFGGLQSRSERYRQKNNPLSSQRMVDYHEAYFLYRVIPAVKTGGLGNLLQNNPAYSGLGTRRHSTYILTQVALGSVALCHPVYSFFLNYLLAYLGWEFDIQFITINAILTPCGGGLEFFHRSLCES